ncbi:hypothetical protein BDV06DRAFT_74199 [Aspergillus oleicola]
MERGHGELNSKSERESPGTTVPNAGRLSSDPPRLRFPLAASRLELRISTLPQALLQRDFLVQHIQDSPVCFRHTVPSISLLLPACCSRLRQECFMQVRSVEAVLLVGPVCKIASGDSRLETRSVKAVDEHTILAPSDSLGPVSVPVYCLTGFCRRFSWKMNPRTSGPTGLVASGDLSRFSDSLSSPCQRD